MKNCLLLLAMVSFLSARSQSEADRIMEKATCNCVGKMFEAIDGGKDSFNTCFIKSLGKDTVLLNKECIRLYGNASAESSYKFGNEFFKRSMVRLVYSCHSYFKNMDSLRYRQFNSLNKDSVRSSIASMNAMDSSLRNKDFFATRGMFYFALGDYTAAGKDLDASLAIDSNTVQGLFFKAWLLEIRKDYAAANKLYTQLATLTKTNEFNIYAAIADRKRLGVK